MLLVVVSCLAIRACLAGFQSLTFLPLFCSLASAAWSLLVTFACSILVRVFLQHATPTVSRPCFRNRFSISAYAFGVSG